LALTHIGIGPGDEVLAPAFHCRAMVEPVLASCARAVYYGINPDTSVSLDDISTRVTPATKALLVAHYFGFSQPAMTQIRAICDERKIALIEDCAHALIGEAQSKVLGSIGDYAIVSVRKFFPVADGGYLLSGRHSLAGLSVEECGLVGEIRAAADILEEAVGHGRPRALHLLLAPLFRLKRMIWSGSPPMQSPITDAPAFSYFDPALPLLAMSRASKVVMRFTSVARIVNRRRANYSKLVHHLGGLGSARPLLPELPDGVVPYMFPLLIDNAEILFPRLKRLGVPIYRWEETPAGICAVTDRYRLGLLQLPCHQEMRDAEMDWMVERLRSVLL
jgi:dTDP-4-amino-4,6-dideoxygalactose transaminase